MFSADFKDPNSFANFKQVAITHSDLKLKTDFTKKILIGSVEHTAVTGAANVKEVVLDSNNLEIYAAAVNGIPVKFTLGENHPVFGTALHIPLPDNTPANTNVSIKVDYSTTSKCLAAQWLEPSQTVGKKHPYLFTQCQPIYARTLVPIMDTPAVKLTYYAEISVPAELRALMSAVPVKEEVVDGWKVCSFKQAIAIPSYLLAIAVGNIEGRRVGPRSTVWSEPELVEAAAWEFADTETFIATGEKLLTPYVWGVYDVLLLPTSFPYGGMENPCLTFVTPSLLAGDRSLVDVVAHEIAHSWMGNLVTSASWEHFWLNEGFTMCVERKIVKMLHGEPARHFSAIIGVKALQESVELFDKQGHPEYSHLVPQLDGVDPDDVFSSVPYEKGFHLLFYLETILGGADVFDPFLVNHVETFSHKSITTEDFKRNLYSFFEKHGGAEKVKILDMVDWDTWFNKPGMPPVANVFDTTMAASCADLANKWYQHRHSDAEELRAKFAPSDISKFHAFQTVVFLEQLLDKPEVIPIAALDIMEELYGFKSVKNCEIRCRWYELCLKAERDAVFDGVVDFVTNMGRMKYVRPLYRALAKTKNGKKLAQDTFTKHEQFYHPICAGMVRKDIMGL